MFIQDTQLLCSSAFILVVAHSSKGVAGLGDLTCQTCIGLYSKFRLAHHRKGFDEPVGPPAAPLQEAAIQDAPDTREIMQEALSKSGIPAMSWDVILCDLPKPRSTKGRVPESERDSLFNVHRFVAEHPKLCVMLHRYTLREIENKYAREISEAKSKRKKEANLQQLVKARMPKVPMYCNLCGVDFDLPQAANANHLPLGDDSTACFLYEIYKHKYG